MLNLGGALGGNFLARKPNSTYGALGAMGAVAQPGVNQASQAAAQNGVPMSAQAQQQLNMTQPTPAPVQGGALGVPNQALLGAQRQIPAPSQTPGQQPGQQQNGFNQILMQMMGKLFPNTQGQ